MANQQKVAVIGAGVMGEALIAALIGSGIEPSVISIVEKRPERCNELIGKYAITTDSLINSVATNDVILLVVKPQDMQALLGEIKPHINAKALVMSFVAGKKIGFIAENLAPLQPIVRIMPNTPTSVGLGAAGYSFGSTPAYFFAFVEAMVEGAVALGLSREDATTLTIQTIVGSAALLEKSGDSPTTLREKVTSPNGTTAAALASFSQDHLSEIVARAMKAAHTRSQELA